METITYNAEEEREVIMQDEKNVETLSFHRSGSMSFVSMNNGKEKKGRGLWLIKDENIRIIALTDTIDATYNIDNGILTLTTSEKETDEFYGYTSIVKYKNKYAGTIGVFSRGYNELLAKDFFGTAGADLSSFNLIDRINLFFKNNPNVYFSDEELVDTVYTVEELMIEAGCDVKEVNFY